MLVYIDRDFETIVPDYLVHIESQLDQIEVHLNNKQYRAVERLALQIRDSAKNYGFLKAGHLASKINFYSKYRSDESIHEVIREVRSYFERCSIQYVDL